MADRPPSDENMAVSSDTSASQQTLRENTKDETDLRGAQSNSKMDAPKKKTFKITSVTKSSGSQRGGSGDLTQDNDGDSIDDLDETVDSHTEDLSSEMYDTCSKATDVDSQDPLLTPEEVVKEKPGRFKVVKIDTKEPFRRGRWLCYDYPDAPDKSEPKAEEVQNVASSTITNSTHQVHGIDDPSKNPLLAGASGTVPSHPQSSTPAENVSGSMKGPGEVSQPQQSAASQSGVTQLSSQVGQALPNATYSNHVAQSMPAYSVASTLPFSSQSGQQMPYTLQGGGSGQSKSHSLSVPGGGQPLRAGGSAPNLQQQPVANQTKTSQSVSGTIPYPSTQQQQLPQQQQQPVAQATSIPANVHSQPAPVSGSGSTPQPQFPGAMQRGGEYLNAAPQGMGQLSASQQSQQTQQAQPVYDMPAQQPAAGYSLVSSGSSSSGVPQQNHTSDSPHSDSSTAVDPSMTASSSLSGVNLSTTVPILTEGSERMEDVMAGLGPGLEPLQIAVGGITNSNPEDDMTTEDAGSSTVAIDNKIEQAMDLVKSHLMYAVREEVEVLKEQIKELMERLAQLEYENNILRAAATPDTLAKLTPPSQSNQPPPPPSSSSSS